MIAGLQVGGAESGRTLHDEIDYDVGDGWGWEARRRKGRKRDSK